MAVGLVALSAPSLASAQTFTGTLSSGVGKTWYRPDGSCVQETSTRLYERIDVFATQTGTYTFTATRTSGTGIMIDAFRTFPSSNCLADRYNDGVASSSTVASVTMEVSDVDIPIVLVVSSTSTLSTGGYTVTVSGPAAVEGDCAGTGTLTTTTQSAPIGGGSYSTTYTPPAGVSCSGFAILNRPAWITGMPASGGGTTVIGYTVATNPGGPRTAQVSIGTRTLTVEQAGTCNFTLTPTSRTVSGAGGSSTTSIGVNSGCPWDASTTADWITIQNASGTGSGTLSFTVAENTGSARTGTIDVEGTTLTVNQNAACSYVLGATSLDVAASATTQTVSVTTQTGCPITGVADVAWITPQASGTGSGTTSFAIAANTGAARSGTVAIGDETITVDQASGCTLSLPASATTVPAAGTTSSFLVTTGAGCAYTVASDVAWLSPSVGAGGVEFTVEPSSGASRVGTITVTSTSTAASAAYVVTQSSGCVPVLASPGEARDAAAGSGSFGVTIDGGCSYTATSDVAWIPSVAVTASGVDFSVDANEAVERTGTIVVTAAGGSVSYAITQANGCTVSVQDAPLVADPQGNGAEGGYLVDVITGEGCEWSIEASDGWLECTPTPTGLVVFAEWNVDPARVGTVTVTAAGSGATDVLEVQQASAIPPPVITQQPMDEKSFVGELVVFIVQATTEAGSVSYQWRKNGVELPFATNNALWIPVELEDAGDYDVVVTGIGGSVVSDLATLEVSERSSGGCAVVPGARAEGGSTLGLLLAALALVTLLRRSRTRLRAARSRAAMT